MRCYDEELKFDAINVEDILYGLDIDLYIENMIRDKVSKYNAYFRYYSDTHYLLNDPLSDLDPKEYRIAVITKFIFARSYLKIVLDSIHEDLLIIKGDV